MLTKRGAHVYGTARTVEKAQGACKQVGGSTTPVACELADPKSVRQCVDTLKQAGIKFDAIICNAGIMALPKLQQAHGYELQFFTNHIGHFGLVTGLLESLSDTGRVVILSSEGHKMAPRGAIQFDNLAGDRNYQAWSAYGQSKMANVLFAKELSRRFAGTRKTANAVHPGVIKTNLFRSTNGPVEFVMTLASPLLLKSVAQGAATSCYAAVHAQTAAISGAYFASCNVASCRKDADNPELARKLWEKSEEIVKKLS